MSATTITPQDHRDRDRNPWRRGPDGAMGPTPETTMADYELFTAMCPIDRGPRPWWRLRADSEHIAHQVLVPYPIARMVGPIVAPSRRQALRSILRRHPLRANLGTDTPGVPATIEYSSIFYTAHAHQAMPGGIPALLDAIAAHIAADVTRDQDAAIGEVDSRIGQVVGRYGWPLTIWHERGWPDAPDPLDRLDLTLAFLPRADKAQAPIPD